MIPIKYVKRNNDPHYTTNVIYESYKPKNFDTMQKYLNFIFNQRSIMPNYTVNNKQNVKDIIDPLSNPNIAPEIQDYYESIIELKLPETIAQDKILMFHDK